MEKIKGYGSLYKVGANKLECVINGKKTLVANMLKGNIPLTYGFVYKVSEKEWDDFDIRAMQVFPPNEVKSILEVCEKLS